MKYNYKVGDHIYFKTSNNEYYGRITDYITGGPVYKEFDYIVEVNKHQSWFIRRNQIIQPKYSSFLDKLGEI